MKKHPQEKYVKFSPIPLKNRSWPDNELTVPPIWCSVDLRDGNQALIEPMGAERKIRMFNTLIAMGFKEIEVGFPAASQTDFDFVRHLIESELIPKDTTIQVLTQSREELINRTFEAISGTDRCIIHLYNSTSELQRRVVFEKDPAGIIDIATSGAKQIRQLSQKYQSTEIKYQYSPESFTGTELPFAKEICERVMEIFQPTPDRKMIINLPATVEMSSPNSYADQIEWFHKNIDNRNGITLSLHPHNDRGTGIAAAELGLLAGADRVEGTLFGNGERSGNVDIVNLALNFYSQGIYPNLDISNIDEIVRTAEYCNRLPIHPRHPYAGELVYTSFSGSHQDAIKKGFAAMDASNTGLWEVPYIPMDPKDVGRDYEAVVRVNSQSGKGGIGYLLEKDFGISIPRKVLIELSGIVQKVVDDTEAEISSEKIWQILNSEYINQGPNISLTSYNIKQSSYASERFLLDAAIEHKSKKKNVSGSGNGPINAYTSALKKELGLNFQIVDYKEHSTERGSASEAISFIEVCDENQKTWFGIGVHPNIISSSLHALTAAVNRMMSSTE